MTTISFSYDERNSMAQKTIEYLLSLGLFTNVQTSSPAKKRTLKAIADARAGKGVTHCDTFEDYLKAVQE